MAALAASAAVSPGVQGVLDVIQQLSTEPVNVQLQGIVDSRLYAALGVHRCESVHVVSELQYACELGVFMDAALRLGLNGVPVILLSSFVHSDQNWWHAMELFNSSRLENVTNPGFPSIYIQTLDTSNRRAAIAVACVVPFFSTVDAHLSFFKRLVRSIDVSGWVTVVGDLVRVIATISPRGGPPLILQNQGRQLQHGVISAVFKSILSPASPFLKNVPLGYIVNAYTPDVALDPFVEWLLRQQVSRRELQRVLDYAPTSSAGWQRLRQFMDLHYPSDAYYEIAVRDRTLDPSHEHVVDQLTQRLERAPMLDIPATIPRIMRFVHAEPGAGAGEDPTKSNLQLTAYERLVNARVGQQLTLIGQRRAEEAASEAAVAPAPAPHPKHRRDRDDDKDGNASSKRQA